MHLVNATLWTMLHLVLRPKLGDVTWDSDATDLVSINDPVMIGWASSFIFTFTSKRNCLLRNIFVPEGACTKMDPLITQCIWWEKLILTTLHNKPGPYLGWARSTSYRATYILTEPWRHPSTHRSMKKRNSLKARIWPTNDCIQLKSYYPEN